MVLARRALRGLTLVELLIAATMMSILFLGLTTHLRGGITVWQRVTQTGEAIQRQRIAWDWLERDLANAYPYTEARQEPDKLPDVQFSSNRLAFVTIQPARHESDHSTVRYVTYECVEHQGIQGLWRTSQTIGEARAKREALPVLLWTGCDSFTIQYAYLPAQPGGEPKPLEWNTECKQKLNEKLPHLLKISLNGSAQQSQRLLTIPPGTVIKFDETPPAGTLPPS